ncbi:MAG: HTTM domain-containing protein [Planctomycetaceae bacterium]
MDPSRNGPWWTRLARAAFTLDARSLAVYRIALGAVVCADCASRFRDFDLMFAIDGVFPPDVVRRQLGGSTAWSLAWLHDSTAWNAAVLALEGVAGVLLAAGVATRLATALAWLAVVSVYRRTYPAANAGDAWLACQLFWSMFIPLGACWSWDALRRGRAGPQAACCSVATAALVLQLVAVYASAGIAKCNATWLDGAAVANALSVHNFGSTLGMAWADAGVFGRPAAWAVVLLELAVPPLLILRPAPRVRLAAAAAFVAFHAAIWLFMSVGLFVPISLAAWLPMLPAQAWDRGRSPAAGAAATGLPRPAAWACTAGMAVAAASLVHARWRGGPPPAPLAAVVNLTAQHQDWPMFGTVPPVEQGVYARAVLADGAVVDLMRGGRQCGSGLAADGFTSLPHHRWHKLCWVLAAPGSHDLGVAVAAGLARRWNAAHAPDVAVRSVEIRHAVQRRGDSAAGEYEHIVACWPERTPAGGGNLERFLQATAPSSAAADEMR